MMRRRTLFVALLLTGFTGLILASDKPGTSAARKFSPVVSESRILGNIYYLASEECEGRGSTTQGIHKAADYIVEQLKQAGLQPAGVDGSYFQPFDFASGPKLGKDHHLVFKIGGDEIAAAKEDLQVLGVGNAGGGNGVGLVFAGFGITSTKPKYDDYEGQDVAGKAVVFIRRTPRQDNKQKPNFEGQEDLASLASKVKAAAKHKAAAILVVNDAPTAAEKDQLSTFAYAGTRAEKETPPVFHVKRAVIDQILKKAGDKTLADLEKQIDADLKPASFSVSGVTVSFKADINRDPNKIKNILATVPGEGELADEIIVVGSHYDHVGRGETGSLAGSREIHFGADDNASGTVCNLEIARRWQQMQSGPDALKNRRRVIFMWYAAEEWGLIGSDYYVRNPIFPLDRVAAMFNLDMVGRLGFDEKRVGPNQSAEDVKKRKFPLEVLGTTSAKEFPGLVEKANKDLGVDLTMPTSSQFFGASDHYSFYKKNIPVIFFFTGLHPQYHRPTDVWQTINIPGIRQCAELGQNLLEGLVTMPRPQFVKATPTTRANRPAPEQKTDTARSRTGIRVSIGIQPAYNDTAEGVMVDGVSPGRAAEKAGIKAGDRILNVNGQAVKDVQGYMAVLNKFKAGDTVEMELDRKGDKVKLKVTLEAPRN